MSYLLSLETSTPILSVALHQEGKLITSIEHHIAREHSKKLIEMIDALLNFADKPLQALGAIAISAGPGSYTGLRIGASFAKGLCLGADLPLIAIDSLTPVLQTAQSYAIQGCYCILLDAGRGKAYTLIANADGKVFAPMKKLCVMAEAFAEWLDKDLVYFVGDCEAYYNHLKPHPNARFLPRIYPNASAMGELVHAKFTQKDFADITYFEPSLVE